MQVISTTALHNYKVPVIIKKLKNFTFCLGKSRENFINIFQDFPGLTNKIQGLSRTFQDSKKNPGLFQDVATLSNGILNSTYSPKTFQMKKTVYIEIAKILMSLCDP